MSEEQNEGLSDEEAIMKIAQAMKDNSPSQDEKTNVHTFLNEVVKAEDNTKVGNLKRDKDLDEVGRPCYHVRGAKEMALISKDIMDNDFFEKFFEQDAQNTLSTSLSVEGFLVKQATTQTKQVADATRRRKINKGWFGSEKIEEQGGDINK
jgi:hypothetical protein